MAKIDVETLKYILQRNETDIRKINEIMQDIQMELQAEEEERANRPPPVKKQYTILLSDNDGSLVKKDLTGWIVQIPEDESASSTGDRIIRAAYEFNTTPKGIRMPVKTIGEACEAVTAKNFKEQQVWVRTKTPVMVVAAPNALPMERTE
ncbi:MAG: hypothetical protein CNC89_00495 [Puniceicoccaceae bacterium MED-G31]|nr:hypothetical protein [Coraliomargarita sp.]PDH30394.1 MAG: hypothetical protein CNC89_00495 [Puniceicoccaceae bacterium MED-G31]HBO57113.1 hypothetical protein [Opitutae bacterium]|tara:strand:+ start:290 stop:739 length:450 start_codon:yes stop_codon:yes gene_type:complete